MELRQTNVLSWVVQPETLVRGIWAVQVMFTVAVEPIATPPKSTGRVHDRGRATGEPRQ